MCCTEVSQLGKNEKPSLEGAPVGYGSPSGKRVRGKSRREFESRAFRVKPIDVDAILESLDKDLLDPGDNPWGGANLEPCGDENCRCSKTMETPADGRRQLS